MDFMDDTSPLQHTPLRAVRKDEVGEVVFTARWQEYMKLDSSLSLVLDELDVEVTQRTASLMASIVKWLGTSVGQGFTEDAAKLINKIGDSKSGMVAAWAVFSRRIRWLNQGRHILEYIMMTPEDAATDTPAILTTTDYDVANQLMAWLGTREGINFIWACHAEMNSKRGWNSRRQLPPCLLSDPRLARAY